jgi:hypothetical protein
MKTTVKVLSLAGCILLIMACSKSDPLCEDSNTAVEKSAATEYVAGTIFQLEGYSLYKTWAVTDGTLLQDVSWENIGAIEFLGGRDFRFFFREIREGGNEMEYYGKISASGELKFQMPAPIFYLPDGTPFYIIDLIKSHGCVMDVWGPGVNQGTLYFKGRFDGTRLYAEAKFMAATVSEGCIGLYFAYDGDVHWIFAYDMTVACD